MRWEIHQLDIKTSFLNGIVKEEMYIEKPLGVKTHDSKTYLCKLEKAMYELKRHHSAYSYMRILKIT